MITKEWISLTEEQKKIILKHQFSAPIKLGEIAKDFGLVVKIATLPADISGEIKEINNTVIIKVNRHDVKARRRYTLAHEIAHFLLHRHLLGQGISDDILYRSSQSDEIEAEANRLASDIIMPMKLVEEIIKKHYKGKKDAELYEATAEELEVSTTALKIRLGVK
ncbi:ImmA/IrrE family metallo-endopeptidase [Dickeya chrysanthemi]|uniref:ImmA/IrrE family metallo-endopeptidase n=1 Tax=Dickeya chrysanthemi TaxID=556 RepID=UPI001CF1D33B|nr:ImmA/IrrE family metallo-endopeptidase [Dickeya chrysanthemi]MCA7008862.1 ImmA/IrrE family metallo-endopeptidase [Dickeya chrysanthemi]